MLAAREALPADGTGQSLRSAEEGKRSLAMGWNYFNEENYRFAASSFRIAVDYPESSLEARFGLGLSQMKLGEKQEALVEFRYLVDKGYKTDEVLPPLMWLLIENRQYREAKKYLLLVNESDQKKQWSTMISTGAFTSRAEAAIKNRKTGEIMDAVKDNRDLLSSCTAPYVFFNSARALSESEMSMEARGIHSDIMRSCPGDLELRGLALGELSRLEAPADTMERLRDERERHGSDSGYAMKLDAIESSVLMRMLEGAEPSSKEAYALVERINALKPEDEGMTARLSWDSLNLKQYDKALDGFTRLRESDPGNAEYALGLAYTLIALNQNRKALVIADSFSDKGEEFRRISLNAHAGIGRQAYQRRDYRTALEHYSKVLEMEPGNDEALSLTAWSHYNSGDFERALPYFESKYQQVQDPAYVIPMLSIYESSDRIKADAFKEGLSRSGRAESVTALADYYSAKDRNITAAQVTDESSEICYYNADKPWLDLGFEARDKSGDPGMSKLRELTSSLSVHYPFSGGRELELSVRHISLDSDTPLSGAFVGNFGGTLQPWGIINSVSLIEPELRFSQEGTVSYSLALGGSPSGGEASQRPTFSIGARTSKWMLEAHRSPVRESILSYSGLKDPYGPSWWGGVLKSGIKGSLSSNPSGRYVLYIEAGYDEYTGENVVDNNAYNATISVGRPLSGRNTDITIGGFITAMGFDIDSNHFTFGHGGYFSPQSFMAAGPTLRITSKRCRTLWFDLQAAVSYISHKTDDSPQYPLDPAKTGIYAAENTSDTGFSLRGEVRKLISSRWSAGVSLAMDNSSQYDQWQAGAGLRYLAGGRTTVMP